MAPRSDNRVRALSSEMRRGRSSFEETPIFSSFHVYEAFMRAGAHVQSNASANCRASHSARSNKEDVLGSVWLRSRDSEWSSTRCAESYRIYATHCLASGSLSIGGCSRCCRKTGDRKSFAIALSIGGLYRRPGGQVGQRLLPPPSPSRRPLDPTLDAAPADGDRDRTRRHDRLGGAGSQRDRG